MNGIITTSQTLYQTIPELQEGENNIHKKQIQPLNRPNLQDSQLNVPILDENNDFTRQERRNLILNINKLLIYQQLVQVGLIIICFWFPEFSYPYFNFFYNQQYQIRISTILIVGITLALLLTVRFYKKLRQNNSYKTLIYIMYFVFYTLTSHSITFGVYYFYYQSWKYDSKIFYELYFLSQCYGGIPIVVLFMLIQFQFQLKDINENNLQLSDYNFPLVLFPILIVLVLKYFYYYYGIIPWIFINILSPLWPFLFTIFYIPSILQIYKGKFQLTEPYVGSVLTISNMFLLCLKD